MKKYYISAIILLLLLIYFLYFFYQVTFKEGLNGFNQYYKLFIWTLLYGYAIYELISKSISEIRKEPLKDELSKRINIKARSQAFTISFFLWLILIIIYKSNKINIPFDILIISGMLGMSGIDICCHLYYKFFGNVNE